MVFRVKTISSGALAFKNRRTASRPSTSACVASTLIYNHYDLYKSYDKVRSYCPEWKPEYLICGHESGHLYGEI